MFHSRLKFPDSNFRLFFPKFQLCSNDLMTLLPIFSYLQSFFTAMLFSFTYLTFHLRTSSVKYFLMILQLTGALWCPNLFLCPFLTIFAWELQSLRFCSLRQTSIDWWKSGLHFLSYSLVEVAGFLSIFAKLGMPILNIFTARLHSETLTQVFCSFPTTIKSSAAFLHFNCADPPFFACSFLFTKGTG
jgi:hypothetical protein